MSDMKTAVLFDLDGTLLDSLGDLQSAINYTLARYGAPPRSLEEVRRAVGNGARYLVKQCMPPELDETETDRALGIYQTYYAAHCQEKTTVYEGIGAALEEIRGRYPTAIVSNKPDGAVKALCRQYFPGIYALGETPDCPRKPAPDMVRRAMAALGAEHCVYVGDSETDVLTAKNAGVPCVSVLWGFRDAETLRQAGATCFCGTPAELPRIIRERINL